MARRYMVSPFSTAWHEDSGDMHYEYWFKPTTQTWTISNFDLHNGTVESQQTPQNWEPT